MVLKAKNKKILSRFIDTARLFSAIRFVGVLLLVYGVTFGPLLLLAFWNISLAFAYLVLIALAELVWTAYETDR
jgi:hypothetical protein